MSRVGISATRPYESGILEMPFAVSNSVLTFFRSIQRGNSFPGDADASETTNLVHLDGRTSYSRSPDLRTSRGPGLRTQQTKLTLKGTVTSFEWTNPHSQIHLDISDDKGNVVQWNFETQPPNILVMPAGPRIRSSREIRLRLSEIPRRMGRRSALFRR